MRERILIIEDDQALAAQMVTQLKLADFDPEHWSDARPVTETALGDARLVILDLMLPSAYGLDVLKQLRQVSEVPVLILSARTDSQDKVRALKLGADDYLTKPFWPEELLERVRARLRRPSLQRGDEQKLTVGPLELDLLARTAKVAGAAVELTRVELDLLAALVKRKGEAVTRKWLLGHVLDPERESSERTLDVHVSRLRKKLGAEPAIETVWGIGYRLKAQG